MTSMTSDMTTDIPTTEIAADGPAVEAANDVPRDVSTDETTVSKSTEPTVESPPASRSSYSEEPIATVTTSDEAAWRTISVKPRVDSFNQRELLDQLQKARTDGCLSIALDLKGNRFLSFPVIKTCVEIAREVTEKGGAFALLTYSEKTRRHFEIYGSLDHVLLLKDSTELPAAVNQATARPPVLAAEAAPRKPSED